MNAPYSSDTRAKGWRLELDYERIRQSDTWALAPPELRPWLLMLLMVAWEQTPCGSLPDNDELIAVRIGMPLETFTAAKKVLLRGWHKAADGRLYHRTLTEHVLEMIGRRRKVADRVDRHRAAKRGDTPGVTRYTDVTHVEVARDPAVTYASATPPEPEPVFSEEAIASPGADAPHSASPPVPDLKSDPLKALFDRGVTLLGDTKSARGMLGKLRKEFGDVAVMGAIARAEEIQPSDPIPWLIEACKLSRSDLRPDGPLPNGKVQIGGIPYDESVAHVILAATRSAA
ncbi:DUF1376 domain-containing protein [Sinimarinibacterium sp. CAU 1509]|uniref:DUF1376 domain-containing protein n=1 Tax=Sinimarinibacterium sp. CAU 1509 TaxID=2562283 RepID=UPI0010AD3B38|nr:DUF1376 domain-containing protein [Sinimarinibacterium sp. CAU 1509]TJY59420.1 DUF1376 domain-containing protein [Sinimarinibacterium sp. CAU 1509]